MAKCLSPNCGYEWIPRKANPLKCPKCANANWDRPRTGRHKEVEAVVPVLHSNVDLDPDGAMMQTVPDNRIAKAKERAMELLGRIG
jgi:hypothetical protein